MTERVRVAVLLGVSLLVYGNTLTNGFVFDDDAYILRNATVTSLSIKGLFAPDRANAFLRFFRPVTFGSYQINWALGGGQPLGYHLLNVLLNALVTVLLFLVVKKLLEDRMEGTTIAFAAALLFAVHPIHTEAVAWIVGRAELLAAGFLLTAWLMHLKDRPYMAVGCFFLALLSKESAIAFLPLAIAGDYARGKIKPLARYAWITAAGFLYIEILWGIQGGHLGEKNVNPLDNPLAGISGNLRILNALRVAWKYVGLHFYPATLSCDYSYNSIALYSNMWQLAPAAAAAILVAALWIWAVWTKRCGWIIAGSIYLAGFAATANVLVPTRTIMGERLAYLPSAGFCLLLALLWNRLESYNRKIAWVVLGVVLAAFAGRTVARNRDWENNLTLFSAGVKAVPKSAKMHRELGAELMKRGRLEDARAEFKTALDIFPEYPEVLELYGIVESGTGKDEAALALMEKALSMTPKTQDDYDFRAVNLAAELMKLGKSEDALKLLNDEIANFPGSSRAWSNRAVIRYGRGELAWAKTDATEALRLDGTNRQAQTLLQLLSAPAFSVAPK